MFSDNDLKKIFSVLGGISDSVPKGTLITLATVPTKLPSNPLVGRLWVQFVNEDLVDIQLCDSVGVVFLTLAPGQKSEKYCATAAIDFYGKVAAGTADTGVRVIEGK